jgi:hypothetical protein
MKVRLKQNAVINGQFYPAQTQVEVPEIGVLQAAYERAAKLKRQQPQPAQQSVAPASDDVTQAFNQEFERLKAAVEQLRGEFEAVKSIAKPVMVEPATAQKLALLVAGMAKAEKLADIRQAALQLEEWADSLLEAEQHTE